MKILDELRRLVSASSATRLDDLARALAADRAARRAEAWAVEAFPFAISALKELASRGIDGVDLTAASLPRRLRRIPAGGLAQLARLLASTAGVKVEASRYGFTLSWGE